jgi:hypothetical protein
VSDVLFVRELAADHDLVLAFASDGSPAWALDLGSGLQWWYPGGDRTRVREAIAEHWADFATMPITAASRAGPHPALELGRRADAAARVEPPPPDPVPWSRRLDAFLRGLSVPERVAVSVGVVLVAVAVVPWLFSFLFAGTSAAHGVDSTSVPPVAVAGERCDVRGEVSHDAAGHVLVCVSPSRALSFRLEWRSTT